MLLLTYFATVVIQCQAAFEQCARLVLYCPCLYGGQLSEGKVQEWGVDSDQARRQLSSQPGVKV